MIRNKRQKEILPELKVCQSKYAQIYNPSTKTAIIAKITIEKRELQNK